jgi:hypothetical protein
MPQNPWDDPKIAAQQAFNQGAAAAQQRYEAGLQQAIAQVRGELDQKINRAVGGVRRQATEELQRTVAQVDKRLADLATVAAALSTSQSGGGGSEAGSLYIEDIPGRRIPWVYLVEIPIKGTDLSVREQSVTVTQEGPFVAERRWATFLSAYEYQVTDEASASVAKFPGRSSGRYRPVHSASDYADTHHNSASENAAWITLSQEGGGALVVPSGQIAIPSAASSFRTMQFDGVIQIEDSGSNWPRQNRPIPSAFWAPETNGPIHLSALDFFERGSGITFRVKPNHANNPPAGNVTGANVFPNSGSIDGYPFGAGQYDVHEGICTPDAVTAEDDVYTPIETDPIQRLPDGYLVLALEGYRIGQPTGPVR